MSSIASKQDFVPYVDSNLNSISSDLRALSLTIHDNPELNFKEYIAHKTLTSFLKRQKGWKVTPSAYGLETAFVAVFDSGRKGPVVSYNAEYGKFRVLIPLFEDLIDKVNQMHFQVSVMPAVIISSP